MSDLSSSHHVRLRRAEHHLKRLNQEIRAWPNQHQVRPVTRFDHETGMHIDTAELPEPIPDDVFGALIGDVLHNLRSALDHLAYELAVAHSGTLAKKVAEDSEFPIFLCEPTNDRWKKRIQAWAPEAQKVVETLQPYQPHDFPVHGLRALYRLSNIDKHRRPALAAYSIDGYSVWPLDGSEFEFFERNGSSVFLEHGTPRVLARYRGVSREKVNVGYRFSYGIAFNEPTAIPEGAWVLEILAGIKAYIEGTVFPVFEPYL